MGLPSKLKNMNAFVDGQGFIGVVSEFEMPKLAIKTEDFRAGGMLGDVAIDMGLEKLEASITMAGLTVQNMRKFGTAKIDGVRARLVGAYQRDDGSSPQAVECYIGGRFNEIDFGSSKAGEDTEHKYAMQLTYLRVAIDGREEVEIDMLNGAFIVDGIDRYSEIMAALQ